MNTTKKITTFDLIALINEKHAKACCIMDEYLFNIYILNGGVTLLEYGGEFGYGDEYVITDKDFTITMDDRFITIRRNGDDEDIELALLAESPLTPTLPPIGIHDVYCRMVSPDGEDETFVTFQSLCEVQAPVDSHGKRNGSSVTLIKINSLHIGELYNSPQLKLYHEHSNTFTIRCRPPSSFIHCGHWQDFGRACSLLLT